MVLAVDTPDAFFFAHPHTELRFSPRREKPVGTSRALFDGEWYPAERIALSNEHTGYVVYDKAGAASLVIVETKTKRVTERRRLAAFERLEGAYEKTTQSRLAPTHDGWELTITVFLRDFELPAPGAPNTSGTTTTVHRFSRGVFVAK